ncbi:MAG: N-6 DNA methylase [Planctomycetota bacterium]
MSAELTQNISRGVSALARDLEASPSDPAVLLATYQLLASMLAPERAGESDVGASGEALGAFGNVVARAATAPSRLEAWKSIASTYPVLLDGSGERRVSGSYYTPDGLVGHLLDAALEPVIESRCASAREWALREGRSAHEAQQAALLKMRICDPACGCGHLLLAAGERLAARLAIVRDVPEGLDEAMRDVLDRCIVGTDIDPVAVELCRICMRFAAHDVIETSHNIRTCDALLDGPADWNGTCDVVLGNPPFIDSETMVREMPDTRQQIAARYASARGNWDLSVPFIEHASTLLRDDGRLALVIPSRVLSSDYAATVQSMLLEQGLLECHDFSRAKPFQGADVAVAIIAASAKPTGGPTTFVTYDADLQESRRVDVPVTTLRHLPAGYVGAAHRLTNARLVSWRRAATRLGDICATSDGATTAEAYQIREHLQDSEADPSAVRLVNTGTIDPFALLWGRRVIRYLGFQGSHPCLTGAALREASPRRHAQAMEPGVVLAGLARRLEAAVAPPGYLCGKSAVLVRVTRDDICPHAIAAVLNAPIMTELYRDVFGGRGFGPGSMHIGPRQIEQMPMPDPMYLAPSAAPLDPNTFDRRELTASTLSAIGRWCHDAASGGDVLREEWMTVLNQVVCTVLRTEPEGVTEMVAFRRRGASCES